MFHQILTNFPEKHTTMNNEFYIIFFVYYKRFVCYE